MERFTRMIPKANLPHLKNYKFHSGCSTPLDNILNLIWWNPISNLVPYFVSPNVLTLMGAMSLLVMHYCILAYVPGLESTAAPAWLPLLIAITTAVYMTLDGIDGKQARKLGVSSPLGQLLDHGVDAVVSVFYPYMCFTLFPNGYTIPMMLLCCSSPIHVLCTVWRESEFQTFVHTNGVVGVTETNLAMIGLQILYYYSRPYLYKKIGTVFGNHAIVIFVSRFFPRIVDLGSLIFYVILALAYVEGMSGIVGLLRDTSHRRKYLTFICSAIAHVYPAYYMAYVLPSKSRIIGCLFASTLCAVVCVNNIVCLLSRMPLRSIHWALIPHYVIIMQYFGLGIMNKYGFAVKTLAHATLHKILLAGTIYGFTCIVYIFAKTISEIMEYLDIPLLTVRRGNRPKAS
ncbi:putative CDP-alcohol phosphatidyltransferase class-I family protein C22A12.10 [Babesia sp. Xinjiang]|uniref:putative CDP-alcohol phosphatidyltransferase class-I family protein C22A12.10 n=1 Tax=Babesia sp. Xinjiang TaxID=462227 RepID=UPI000A25BE13|nr:putative CDP-alcohol phosphatidyltransferase class-I family protein C22A12.10 [Babesia sp. Xinjiang]ORM39489.1 putative CDP-alcohol phosphatidyltransferase class-I family protein C22A12.10 [Babesia sp. Xinjiang]